MPDSPSQSRQIAFSWGNFFRYYFYFFYFSGVYQLIIYFSGFSGSTGLRQAVLMSFLWLIPVLLFPRQSKLISAAVGLLLWTTSLVSMGYLALYGQDFSQSVLFIIFESNFKESTEFLESYFSWWMVPALIVYSIIPVIVWKYLQPVYSSLKLRTLLVASMSFIVAWPMIQRLAVQHTSLERGISHQINRMEPVAPWHLIMGYAKYKKTLHEIEKQLLANKNLAPLKNLSDKNAQTKNTLVLVIGESTNRQRMSLYGYQRETTPHLDALKDELLIFQNVYSPRPYTIETLQQVLTFADEKNPTLYLKKPTLINMMKQAGYKTYWITNQQTQTKRNTMLTTFSKQADEQIYLNNNRMQNAAQYDEAVLKPFAKILNNQVAKKFIVVHLLGTHRGYHYRYPESFSFFKRDKNVPVWLNDKQGREYNEYDNAVRYNDFVVASLINILKNSQDNGLLTYFSDHGEEVYDTREKLFTGRNEGAPTSAMYTIPFFVWQSDSWQQHNPLSHRTKIVQRNYSASDFIYTWADLAGIKFNEFDASRSIINNSYTQHPVWIGDPDKPKKLRDLQIEPFLDLHFKQPDLKKMAADNLDVNHENNI